MIGPDPQTDLCTGTKKCNMDKDSLLKGYIGTYYGGLESISSDGKIVSSSARGIQIGCRKDWQKLKGDDKKVYSCPVVNNMLDGTCSFKFDVLGMRTRKVLYGLATRTNSKV